MLIFREHQMGPADTLVRRPRPDSLLIPHDSRAILTEDRMTPRRATSLRPGLRLAATGYVETVQTILGHACLDQSKPNLTVNHEIIRRAFKVAL